MVVFSTITYVSRRSNDTIIVSYSSSICTVFVEKTSDS